MTLLVEKGTFTKTTSTGVPVSQQVNLSNGSLTPKLLILWTTGQTTINGTYRDDSRISYGFSDGTNDACQAYRVDESAETEAYTFHDNAVIAIINLTTNAIVSQADVSAFAAGSFTLNWSVQSNTEALHIHYMVAGGTDITNVSCVSTTTGSTGTGNLSYNGSGTTFTPDFALTMTGADSYVTANTITTSSDDALFCIGAAKSTSKRWVMWGRDETIGTSDCDMYINPDACLSACSVANGAITYLADFVSFDNAAGGGITVNVSDGADATTKKLAFLLIKGGSWDCDTFQQRNGAGTQDVTIESGLNPELVFLGGINSATSGSVVANNYVGIGASDGTNEGASYMGNTNGLGTFAAVNSDLNTKVYRISTPHATATSSTTNAECDMTDMATAGQFTLDWTTADTTLRRMAYWTLGTITSQLFERSISETITTTGSIARIRTVIRNLGNINSILFDGDNDFLQCGNHASLWSQSLSKFSFTFWFYATAYTEGLPVAHAPFQDGCFYCWFRPAGVDNSIDFRMVSNTGTGRKAVVAMSNPAILNGWHHIACVYDNSLGSLNLKIYLDKVAGSTTGEDNFTESINVSQFLAVGDSFAGNMKDFRWYTTTALSQTDINNIYDNNSSAPTPNYWLKMQEGTGSAVDSIDAKTATLENGAAWSTDSPPIDDAISTIDSIAKTATKLRSISETLNITQAVTRVANKFRAISNTINLTDSAAKITAKLRSLIETITTSDTITRIASLFRAMSDTITTTDSIARIASKFRSISESITTSDSVTRLRTILKSLSETITTSDTAARIASKLRSVSETITVSDTISRILSILRSLSETITVVDTIAKVATKLRAASETITTSDSLTEIRIRVRSMAETITTIDTIVKALARSLSETITTTDSVVRVASLFRSVSESITTSDTIARIATKLRSLSETTTITQAVTAFIVITRAISETITTSDTIARLKLGIRSIAETITTTDTLDRIVSMLRSISETITTTDSLAKVASKLRSVSETITSSDILASVIIRIRSVSETIATSDSISILRSVIRAVSETITTSDTIARFKSAIRAISETITTSDTIARVATKLRSISESITTSDTVARIASKFRSISEVITTIDSVVGEFIAGGGQLFERAISETIVLSETIVRTASKFRTIAETITITDTIAKISSLFRTMSETITTTDSIAKIIVRIRDIAETITTSDTIAGITTKLRSLSETITTSDTITRIASKFRSLSETTTITDSIARTIVKLISITESIVSTDSITRLKIAIRSISQTITVTDSVAKILTKIRAMSETISISDSIASALTRVRSIAETITTSDTITRFYLAVRSMSEVMIITGVILRAADVVKYFTGAGSGGRKLKFNRGLRLKKWFK